MDAARRRADDFGAVPESTGERKGDRSTGWGFAVLSDAARNSGANAPSLPNSARGTGGDHFGTPDLGTRGSEGPWLRQEHFERRRTHSASGKYPRSEGRAKTDQEARPDLLPRERARD